MVRVIKTTVYRYGKKIYKRMPNNAKKKFHKLSEKALFSHHTANIPVVGVSKVEMADWTQQHNRPVSIVIPSYNDYPLLKACIESIYATCQHLDYEIIISDDYCQPENRKLLKSLESDKVKVVFRDERGGFAKNVNTGMKHAQYDIVLLNSDIVALPGWLDALQYSAYAIDKKIGMVSPKLIYPDGRIQYGGTYHARVLAPQWFGHKNVGRAANDIQTCVPIYNRAISGACVYIRREVYDKLGGLDENFWLGFEDIDYGLKCWSEGYRCYYNPTSILVHHESATRGYSQGKKELASMRYFWRRWERLFIDLPSLHTKRILKIDYVVSRKATALWRTYVEQQKKAMTLLGHDARIHFVESEIVDEVLVRSLQSRDSLKIACDYGVADTVWLSSLECGRPVYLLPTIESAQFPEDRNRQVSIIARYQPEFNYIAPNRWAADQLRVETAWETSARVVPVIDFEADTTTERKRLIQAFDVDDKMTVSINTFAQNNAITVEYYESENLTVADLHELREKAPMFVLQGKKFTNSFISFALISLGGVLVSPAEDKARYEIQDGYNSLSYDSVDTIEKILGDLVDDEQNRNEIMQNAQKTLSLYQSKSTQDTEAALLGIASSQM